VISAGYTPPEQLNGQAVLQSDFFALGRTFVYLLTAKDPSKLYDAYADELRWREAAPNVSPQLADLLDRMMARFPHQRPQTAGEILQQLAKISGDTYIPQLSSQNTLPWNPPLQEAEPVKPQSSFSTPLPKPPNPTPQTGTPATPTKPANPVQSSASSTPPSTQSSLDPGFVRRCQQEMAEYIGPIAAIICQRTLSQNPGLSPSQFVEALAKKIPNSKHAQEFQRRLLN